MAHEWCSRKIKNIIHKQRENYRKTGKLFKYNCFCVLSMVYCAYVLVLWQDAPSLAAVSFSS